MSRWRPATRPTPRSRAPIAPAGGADRPRGDLHTPGATTIAAVADALGVQRRQLLKAYPVVTESRGLVMAFVRGDHRVNEIKLANALGEGFRPARDDELPGPGGLPGPTPDSRRSATTRSCPAGLPDGRQPPRLPPRVHRRRRRARRLAHRRGGRHRQWPPDPHRAGHRDRQHLQARHALLRAVGRHLPRRERQGAADRHGLLRDRPGADHGGGDRAVRRREGHLVAEGDRALGRGDRRDRQAGHARARRRRGALRRALRRGPEGAPRRSRRRAGREVRRRRAAGGPAAPDGGQALAGFGRARRRRPAAAASITRAACRCRGRPRPSESCGRVSRRARPAPELRAARRASIARARRRPRRCPAPR